MLEKVLQIQFDLRASRVYVSNLRSEIQNRDKKNPFRGMASACL